MNGKPGTWGEKMVSNDTPMTCMSEKFFERHIMDVLRSNGANTLNLVFVFLCCCISSSGVTVTQSSFLRIHSLSCIKHYHADRALHQLRIRGGSVTHELDFSSVLDEIQIQMLHEIENKSTYPSKPLNRSLQIDERLLREEQERTNWELESAFGEKEFSSDKYECFWSLIPCNSWKLHQVHRRNGVKARSADNRFCVAGQRWEWGMLWFDMQCDKMTYFQSEYSRLIDGVLHSQRADMMTDVSSDPNIKIPGERFKTLKEAILEIPNEGYNFILEVFLKVVDRSMIDEWFLQAGFSWPLYGDVLCLIQLNQYSLFGMSRLSMTTLKKMTTTEPGQIWSTWRCCIIFWFRYVLLSCFSMPVVSLGNQEPKWKQLWVFCVRRRESVHAQSGSDYNRVVIWALNSN